MKTSNKIISVLGGVIVGAALGILFAPDKGKNTRKKIAEKGNDVKNDAMSSLNDLLGDLSEKCNSLMDKGENFVNEGIEAAKKEFDSVKDQIK